MYLAAAILVVALVCFAYFVIGSPAVASQQPLTTPTTTQTSNDATTSNNDVTTIATTTKKTVDCWLLKTDTSYDQEFGIDINDMIDEALVIMKESAEATPRHEIIQFWSTYYNKLPPDDDFVTTYRRLVCSLLDACEIIDLAHLACLLLIHATGRRPPETKLALTVLSEGVVTKRLRSINKLFLRLRDERRRRIHHDDDATVTTIDDSVTVAWTRTPILFRAHTPYDIRFLTAKPFVDTVPWNLSTDFGEKNRRVCTYNGTCFDVPNDATIIDLTSIKSTKQQIIRTRIRYAYYTNVESRCDVWTIVLIDGGVIFFVRNTSREPVRIKLISLRVFDVNVVTDDETSTVMHVHKFDEWTKYRFDHLTSNSNGDRADRDNCTIDVTREFGPEEHRWTVNAGIGSTMRSLIIGSYDRLYSTTDGFDSVVNCNDLMRTWLSIRSNLSNGLLTATIDDVCELNCEAKEGAMRGSYKFKINIVS